MTSVLIAIDGERVRRSALDSAFDYCSDMRMKVDLLLVDGGEEVPPLLADFLTRLKQARLDCQLYRRPGPLNQAVIDHTQEHKGIYVILVDGMTWGAGIPFRALKHPVGLLGGAAS